MMNKSTKQYMQGDKVRCPECGHSEFCIGKDDIWTDGELYADCTCCLTSTLVTLLKQKYHKDIGKDFKRDGTEEAIIQYECRICGKIHDLNGMFKLTHYFGTMLTKFDPEPEQWICEQHPNIAPNMLIDTTQGKELTK